jgi:hypothetical protein
VGGKIKYYKIFIISNIKSGWASIVASNKACMAESERTMRAVK